MTTTISKASVIEDIWRNFFDRLKSDITSVSTTNAGTVTIQDYHNIASDKIIDSKTNYPFLVVEDPQIPTSQFTMTRTQIDGSIRIEIYSTNNQAASKFLSRIFESIETYKSDFADVGITCIDVEGTDNDFFTRNTIKGHVRSIVFSFKVRLDRTRGF